MMEGTKEDKLLLRLLPLLEDKLQDFKRKWEPSLPWEYLSPLGSLINACNAMRHVAPHFLSRMVPQFQREAVDMFNALSQDGGWWQP
jgi:hypothetical protein